MRFTLGSKFGLLCFALLAQFLGLCCAFSGQLVCLLTLHGLAGFTILALLLGTCGSGFTFAGLRLSTQAGQFSTFSSDALCFGFLFSLDAGLLSFAGYNSRVHFAKLGKGFIFGLLRFALEFFERFINGYGLNFTNDC